MGYTTTTIQGKEVTVSDRDKKNWEKNVPEKLRNDPDFRTDEGDKLKKKAETLESPKPEPTPEPKSSQDKPGTRYSTRVAGEGSVVTPSSPNLSPGFLKQRAEGTLQDPNPNKVPTGQKVGNKQVRGRSIVTHNCETGITTVDPSGTKGGSKKIVTMSTSDYFNNPKYVRGYTNSKGEFIPFKKN